MLDVVVVGGGPAGALTAYLLARAGFAVAIVERAGLGRRKVCGEYLGARAVARLDAIGLGDVARACGTPVGGIRLQTPGAPAVELRFSGPALACARERLDAALLEAARAAGAAIVRARVDDVLRDGGRIGGVRARSPGGDPLTLAARWTVGADGAGSTVAERAGLARRPRGRARFAIGGHYGGFSDLDGRVEMYAGDGAYVAMNPLGGGIVNALLVVPKERLAAWSADVDAGIAAASRRLSGGRRVLHPAQRVGPRVAVGPLAHAVRSPAVPGLLLVGDAAGMLDPFTGQGLALAIASAAGAAAAIARAARHGGDERTVFARFAGERVRELDRRARLACAVKLLVDAPAVSRRVALALRIPALVGRWLV